MLEKIKDFIKKLNEYGIPIPLVRINGVPTLTGTMTLLSFLTALLGQIGKVTNFLGPVDLSQANYLFLISLGAYLGRRLTNTNKNGTIDIDDTTQTDKDTK
jgi:hypothetical protein